MAQSRNPVEYLRRHGMADEPAGPKPRLDLAALLVHTLPLADPNPPASVLRQFEGDPIPDRGPIRPWPGQT